MELILKVLTEKKKEINSGKQTSKLSKILVIKVNSKPIESIHTSICHTETKDSNILKILFEICHYLIVIYNEIIFKCKTEKYIKTNHQLSNT